jgi:hypothetical protein
MNGVKALDTMFGKAGHNQRAAHGAVIRRKKGHTIFLTRLEQAIVHKEHLTPEIMQVVIELFNNKALFVKIEEDRWIQPYDNMKIEVWSAMFEDNNCYAINRVG